MSLDCGQVPLMEADWSVGNNGLLVGAVAGTDWFMFDVSVSRLVWHYIALDKMLF